MDFGSLQRADGQKVIGGSNVDDSYFVDRWLETDRHLFIPPENNSEKPEFPYLTADGEPNMSFYPDGVVGNIPYTCLDAMKMKEKHPDVLKGQDIPDDELIVLTIE